MRFGRDRLLVASVALLAVTLIATAGLQSAAATALQATLDDHWRGAYDILVTSEKATSDELLSPNSLIGEDERMPLRDLERIRGIDGVDVAAPISQLLVPSLDSARVDVAVPIDLSRSTLDPQDYRLRVRYLTDDGLGERLALAETYRLTLDTSNAPRDIVVDRSAYDDNDCRTQVGDVTVDCGYDYPETEKRYTALIAEESGESGSMGSSGSITSTVVDDDVVFPLPGVALPPTRVTLVDPVAERALLGDGGAFLDPLVTVGAGTRPSVADLDRWSVDQPTSAFTRAISQAVEQQQAMYDNLAGSGQYAEYVAEKQKRGEEPLPVEEVFAAPQHLPVVVSTQRDVPLTVRVDVEAMGPGEMPDVASSYWTVPTFDDAGVAGVPLGAISADVRSLLDPFSTQKLTLPWVGNPDAVPQFGDQGYTGGYFGQVAHSTPAEPTSRAGELVLDSTGHLGTSMDNYWGGDPSSWVNKGPGTSPGMQSTYATVSADQVLQSNDDSGTYLLPIAGFDMDDIVLPADPLSYTPLGAYDPAAATLVRNAAGDDIQHVDLLPVAGGLGLVGARTAAIADIDAVSDSLVDPTMDAVRVRVAGVDRYDAAGIDAVGSVAEAIERLGLAATIVAGSSPQTASMTVDGYAFGTTDVDGEQSVGLLGTVEQRWSALGAAARLGTSVSQATLALLATVIAATLALFAVASLSAVGSRRSGAATLRTVGWTRGRILRWLLAEQWPALAAVLLAGGLAAVLAADDALVLSTTASVVLAVIVIAVVRAVSGASGERMRLATADELLRERPEERPEVRWTNAPTVESHGGYGLPDESSPEKEIVHDRPRSHGRMRLGAESLVGFGLRLVRGDAGSAIGNAAAVLVVMATTACFVLSLGLGQTGAGTSLIAQFGTAQALAPQLALGVVGVVAGVLLTILVRTQALHRRRRSRAVLRELGWVG
ncbi:MAG: hypothetical protein ABWX76_05255, partial [Leifsonia flava]